MHRLFWKFFLSFWLALVLFGGASLWAVSHYIERIRAAQNAMSAHDYAMSQRAAAQAAADRDGIAGLKDWARRVDGLEAVPVLVLDPRFQDLLGREVPLRLQDFLRHRDPFHPPPFPVPDQRRFHMPPLVHAGDGVYLLVPDYHAVTLERILRRPRVMAMPLTLAALVGALVCLALARTLTRPIERLRMATEAYAAGDLSRRVGPSMKGRRDELGELALAFDRMAERLDGLMQSHKRLLRDVSHELRSPLARVQAALGLARQRGGAEAAPELDRIEREAERLNDLVGRLLSLARLESGGQAARREPVDLGALLGTVAADARLEAQARRVEVSLTMARLPAFSGDEALLHSALENVVRNALRYTAEGTRVEISAGTDTAQPGWVAVEVADSGPGVPEAMLPRLFEPFLRVADARDRSSGGYGLGLAIAERAVRLHGGTIAARNREGGGLVVALRLPVAA